MNLKLMTFLFVSPFLQFMSSRSLDFYKMNRYDNRIKQDIFKSETTYQNDYKQFELEDKQSRKCYAESQDVKQIEPRKYIYQDNETFVHWRENAVVPFNLLWRPKAITSTNPYEPFQIPSALPASVNDKEKEKVIKTRPRIYMSPAISMDDIPDPEMRKLLCSHMYTSEWTKAIQESAVHAVQRHIPNTTIEKGGDPVQLKVDLLPPLPDNFRKNGKEWENSQLKYNVDPTKMFWEHKEPPVRCGACFNPTEGLVPQETKDKIASLISKDRLRKPHDAPIPGYAGYQPRFSYGIPLEKTEKP